MWQKLGWCLQIAREEGFYQGKGDLSWSFQAERHFGAKKEVGGQEKLILNDASLWEGNQICSEGQEEEGPTFVPEEHWLTQEENGLCLTAGAEAQSRKPVFDWAGHLHIPALD